MPTVVDLFCGAGGLTHGFILEGGFNVVAGIDFDSVCEYAYTTNNPGAKFLHRDVSKFTSCELLSLYPPDHIKILVGCAPCQPFSRYSNPNREASRRDGKWQLLDRFGDYIRDVEPDIVSMENVPDLIKSAVFSNFVSLLQEKNYFIWYGNVECADYGVPQTRTRLVLLGSRLGDIEMIPPTHTPDMYPTVDDTIGHLPPILAGQADIIDPLHRASFLTEINLQRIQASTPGGTWRDWPENLRLPCHRRNSGRSFGSVYGRMRPDALAPTMTTECNGVGNGRFGHPRQDRAISMREAALFQTFPEDYKFIDPKVGFKFSYLARQIGNAVPVRLGQVIARSIMLHLDIHMI